MPVTDETYYRGDLNIPGTDEATKQRLKWFIENYEKELLLDLFGYGMYKLYSDEANIAEQRWVDLTTGVEYTCYSKGYKWGGIGRLLACYVYYHYMRDQSSKSTPVGEVKGKVENSNSASVNHKMIRAWNEMSESIVQMFYYLNAKKEVYPELYTEGGGYYFTPYYWWPSYGHFNKYGKINAFGI